MPAMVAWKSQGRRCGSVVTNSPQAGSVGSSRVSGGEVFGFEPFVVHVDADLTRSMGARWPLVSASRAKRSAGLVRVVAGEHVFVQQGLGRVVVDAVDGVNG